MAAARSAVPRLSRGLARELDVDLELAVAGVADLELAESVEQRDHGVVEREQARLEALDAVLARPLGEPPQQLAAEAAVLPLVDDRDRRLGDLGLGLAGARSARRRRPRRSAASRAPSASWSTWSTSVKYASSCSLRLSLLPRKRR